MNPFLHHLLIQQMSSYSFLNKKRNLTTHPAEYDTSNFSQSFDSASLQSPDKIQMKVAGETPTKTSDNTDDLEATEGSAHMEIESLLERIDGNPSRYSPLHPRILRMKRAPNITEAKQSSRILEFGDTLKVTNPSLTKSTLDFRIFSNMTQSTSDAREQNPRPPVAESTPETTPELNKRRSSSNNIQVESSSKPSNIEVHNNSSNISKIPDMFYNHIVTPVDAGCNSSNGIVSKQKSPEDDGQVEEFLCKRTAIVDEGEEYINKFTFPSLKKGLFSNTENPGLSKLVEKSIDEKKSGMDNNVMNQNKEEGSIFQPSTPKGTKRLDSVFAPIYNQTKKTNVFKNMDPLKNQGQNEDAYTTETSVCNPEQSLNIFGKTLVEKNNGPSFFSTQPTNQTNSIFSTPTQPQTKQQGLFDTLLNESSKKQTEPSLFTHKPSHTDQTVHKHEGVSPADVSVAPGIFEVLLDPSKKSNTSTFFFGSLKSSITPSFFSNHQSSQDNKPISLFQLDNTKNTDDEDEQALLINPEEETVPGQEDETDPTQSTGKYQYVSYTNTIREVDTYYVVQDTQY